MGGPLFVAVESALPDQRHSGGMVEVIAVAPGVAALSEHASRLTGATAGNQRKDIHPVESAATAPFPPTTASGGPAGGEIPRALSTGAPAFDRARGCSSSMLRRFPSTSSSSVPSQMAEGRDRDHSTADKRKRGQGSTGVCPTWRGTKPATSSGRGTTAAFTEGKRTAPLAGTGLGVRFPKGKWAGNFRNRRSLPSACKHGVSG